MAIEDIVVLTASCDRLNNWTYVRGDRGLVVPVSDINVLSFLPDFIAESLTRGKDDSGIIPRSWLPQAPSGANAVLIGKDTNHGNRAFSYVSLPSTYFK